MSTIEIQTHLSNRHGSSTYYPVRDMSSFTQERYGYVEGFISMTIDGVEMFGPDLWDDVGALWPMLTNMLDDCRASQVGVTGLMERSIPIRLEQIRGWAGNLLLTVGRPEGDHYGVEMRRASVAAADLYPAIARAYLDTFAHFQRIDVPEEVSSVSAEMESHLRSWIDAPGSSWLAAFPG